MSNTDTMDLPEAEDSTAVIITLTPVTLEGAELVEEWNAIFPPLFVHDDMSLIPEEFFDEDKPQSRYWGFLQEVSVEVNNLLGEFSDRGEKACRALANARRDNVGGPTTMTDTVAPYIELLLFTHKLAAHAAFARCRNLQFMGDCRIVLVEVKLAEIQGPIGSMTA